MRTLKGKLRGSGAEGPRTVRNTAVNSKQCFQMSEGRLGLSYIIRILVVGKRCLISSCRVESSSTSNGERF
jgi:hypothetical protein